MCKNFLPEEFRSKQCKISKDFIVRFEKFSFELNFSLARQKLEDVSINFFVLQCGRIRNFMQTLTRYWIWVNNEQQS